MQLKIFFDIANRISTNKRWGVSFFCLSLALLFVLPEVMAWRDIGVCLNFATSIPFMIFLATVLAITGFWYSLFNNYGLAWILTFAPLCVFAQANYMKYSNNNKPLFPWDIMIVWEGLQAANSMADPRVIVMKVLCICLVALLVAVVVIPILPGFSKPLKKRIIILLKRLPNR